uniref:Uncharacterized protein n=1 Tax=Oryza punctata TaxID=4537 RepID=A0A0E0LJC8_ORYPU
MQTNLAGLLSSYSEEATVSCFFLEFNYHVGTSSATPWTNLLCHVLRGLCMTRRYFQVYEDNTLKVPHTDCYCNGELGFLNVTGINQICVFYWFAHGCIH